MSSSSRAVTAQKLLHSIPEQLQKSGMLKLSDRAALLTTGAEMMRSGLVSTAATSSTATSSAVESVGASMSHLARDWQQRLTQGQFLPGQVVELSVDGPSWGTSIALSACHFAQQRLRKQSGQTPWCAFVDCSASLYAPGVFRRGVDISRLLVVRPDEESLSRVALRLVESKSFPVVVVDTTRFSGTLSEINWSTWVRVVRRFNLALENTENTVVLLTESQARRPIPLPVAQRIELTRSALSQLQLSVARDIRGSYLSSQRIAFDSLPQSKQVETATNRSL
jgi:recombination protein RecA